jgi:hypothetical protein
MRLLGALKENDVTAARTAASELDRAAGPHMEFEETVFYPTLETLLGSDFVDQLYHEHTQGQDAIRTLLARERTTPRLHGEQRALVAQVETALEHALSCGSLLGHVDVLDPSVRQAMLGRLVSLRAQGRHWTELPTETRHRST